MLDKSSEQQDSSQNLKFTGEINVTKETNLSRKPTTATGLTVTQEDDNMLDTQPSCDYTHQRQESSVQKKLNEMQAQQNAYLSQA